MPSKGRQFTANAQATSAVTHVRKLVISSFNAAKSTLQLSEVSTGYSSSLTIDVPANAGIADISFDEPGFRFYTGVSGSLPTSVTLFIEYEPGA